MIKRDLIEVGASMLGGLGLGAVGMYLLDPDKGMDRRRMIGKQTHAVLNDASSRLHQAGSRVMHLRDEAADYAGQAGQKMRDLRDSAGEYLHRGAGRLERRLSASTAEQDSGSKMSMALAAVGILAVGGGLMYFLDPVSGRRRRARVRDKATRYAHEAQHSVSSTGRHLTNRAKGIYHDASEMLHSHANDGGHRLGAVEEHGHPVR
jgi:hypothetical protein